MLVAIDGIDGCGKSQQAVNLCAGVKDHFKKIVLLHFPDYDTPSGKLIKEYLHNPPKNQFFFSLLFELNRIERFDTLWQSADPDTIVICDRYYQSGWAYAMARSDVTRNQIEILKQIDHYLPEPDVTVILDIDPKVAGLRNRKSLDELESDLPYQNNVRSNFIKLASENYWTVLDATQDEDFLAEKILSLTLSSSDM